MEKYIAGCKQIRENWFFALVSNFNFTKIQIWIPPRAPPKFRFSNIPSKIVFNEGKNKNKKLIENLFLELNNYFEILIKDCFKAARRKFKVH